MILDESQISLTISISLDLTALSDTTHPNKGQTKLLKIFKYPNPPLNPYCFRSFIHLMLIHVTFPQNGQPYLACWVISNFLTTFLREAPYLVPYFLVIPTFWVLLAISMYCVLLLLVFFLIILLIIFSLLLFVSACYFCVSASFSMYESCMDWGKTN